MSSILKLEFINFHEKNPKVYQLFCKFTEQIIAAGFKSYSAKAVIERIRWHTDIVHNDGDEFKITNNHTAYYARHYMEMNPMYVGFFKTKEVKSDGE
tara:strand:- start:739 stop:1029 length:291 start_codon:yes stop_codon:yes gene_type:complete